MQREDILMVVFCACVAIASKRRDLKRLVLIDVDHKLRQLHVAWNNVFAVDKHRDCLEIARL